MPVVFSKDFHKDLDVDGSLKAKAWDFVRKLSADSDLAGLDLKIPQGVVDRRVRTARVDLNFRAVLFDMSAGGENYYLLAAIKPHDDAYRLAESLELRVNPVNGIAEVLRHREVDQVLSAPRPVVVDDRPLLLPYSEAELTGLGILPEVAKTAVTLRDEDDLQELCTPLPEWQADVLIHLAFGGDIDTARRTYARVEPGDDFSTALRHPASRMQFVVVTDENDDELRAMLEGDFRLWRTFLHPEQRTIAYKEQVNGPFRLSGGAGTGKTVVAIHRASYLATSPSRPRVLLTTFTKTLAGQLEVDLAQLAGPGIVSRVGQLQPGTVRVSGVDAVARAVVAKADGHVPKVVTGPEEDRYWEGVVEALPDLTAVEADLLTPAFLAAEYRTVVLAQELTDRQAYLKAPRRGRGVRLNWLQRSRVWDAVEGFRRALAAEGRTTFADVAARAAAILAEPAMRSKVETFDHVVVDEGQDLNASHWLMLRRLVPEGNNDLFICEDSHQRIYGERLTLGQLGIRIVGRARRLTLNYRTTRQNLRFALSLLTGEAVVDLSGEGESVLGYRSRLSGEEPQPRGFRTEAEEIRHIVDTVRGWLTEGAAVSPASLAVLVRTNRERDEVARIMRSGGIPVETLTADTQSDGVRVATMHRAKGMEFARVVVAGVSDTRVPDPVAMRSTRQEDRADIEQRERLLLYVACTRARDQLHVTWSGKPSRFLQTFT
ncbi:3'-5' exonuclease [Actinokineospora sp. G85]|uniref:3'-5' exonuclease n=1 Tax=Actinokineospora sp. G85 TaxID=3406626 RepID=UPI003C7824FC